MKIVFMGSPEFAVPALNSLLKSVKHKVTCVYTREPKPFGRGHKIKKTPIHVLAEEHNIPVLTPKTLKKEVLNCEADIIVVAAYGMLLPEKLIKSIKYGCINIHPSLLPRWRGAAPIQHALLAGDKSTGVCIMQMVKELDAGDILCKREIEILNYDDFQSLYVKLAKLGAELLIESIDNLDYCVPVKQSKFGITYANKIRKKDIDWSESAEDIERLIRAMQGANCTVKDIRFKILKADYKDIDHTYCSGALVEGAFHIACGVGILIPKIIQLPGKKPIKVEDFLCANKKFLF